MKFAHRVCPDITNLKTGEIFRFQNGLPGLFQFLNGAGSPCTMVEIEKDTWAATLTQKPQQMLREDDLVEVLYVP